MTRNELWNKAIAYHGHVCGGITIGFRAVLYAADLLDLYLDGSDNLNCISECNTCPADAIRALLDCTEENGKLTVLPNGKMIFVFKDLTEGQTLKLTLKTPDRKLSKEESQVYYQMRPDDELFEAEWL